MNPSTKKLIGALFLLPAIALYLAFAATLADFVPDFWLPKLLFFAFAGVVWAFPAKSIFIWMNAEPKNRTMGPDADP
jgi:hypothetical protein